MPNYLRIVQCKYNEARNQIENAIKLLEDELAKSQSITQELNVTDELADVFRDKPVIIIQSATINYIQVNNKLQQAIKLMNEIDLKLYRDALTKEV